MKCPLTERFQKFNTSILSTIWMRGTKTLSCEKFHPSDDNLNHEILDSKSSECHSLYPWFSLSRYRTAPFLLCCSKKIKEWWLVHQEHNWQIIMACQRKIIYETEHLWSCYNHQSPNHTYMNDHEPSQYHAVQRQVRDFTLVTRKKD